MGRMTNGIKTVNAAQLHKYRIKTNKGDFVVCHCTSPKLSDYADRYESVGCSGIPGSPVHVYILWKWEGPQELNFHSSEPADLFRAYFNSNDFMQKAPCIDDKFITHFIEYYYG